MIAGLTAAGPPTTNTSLTPSSFNVANVVCGNVLGSWVNKIPVPRYDARYDADSASGNRTPRVTIALVLLLQPISQLKIWAAVSQRAAPPRRLTPMIVASTDCVLMLAELHADA